MELEADKARLIRAIANIDNKAIFNKVKRQLISVLNLKEESKANTDKLTQQMIQKFSGAWSDSRSAEEIIEEIYNSRLSHTTEKPNPFDE